jgi:predicted nucleotidyltransferase
VLAVAERRGARNVRVFGSVARGDDGPTSDVDLLVDLDEDVSLLGLTGLGNELSDLLGVSVDVVPASMLKPRLRDRVLAEAVPLVGSSPVVIGPQYPRGDD